MKRSWACLVKALTVPGRRTRARVGSMGRDPCWPLIGSHGTEPIAPQQGPGPQSSPLPPVSAHIAAIIRVGEDIPVNDRRSGRDLTAATMAHIIFEEERCGPRIGLGELREIIRSGRIP